MKSPLWKRFLASFGISLIAITSVSIPAQAAGDCKSGYACIWEHDSYSGRSYGGSVAGPVASTINNMASSASANGARCTTARYYDSGSTNSGSYFDLYSRQLMGYNYRDPNLTNGAGYGPYATQNWDNRVSRIIFLGGSYCY